MIYWYGLHFVLFFSYGVFFLQFIKSLKNNDTTKLFAALSIIFMLLLLIDGTELILLNPVVAKSGGWLHVKLLIFVIVMLENLYLIYAIFKKKIFSSKFYEILYYLNYLFFIIMISLAVFKSS